MFEEHEKETEPSISQTPQESDEGRQPLPSSPSPSSPPPDNENKTIIENIEEGFCTVGSDSGIVCYCAGVKCVFEMELYRYKHKQKTYESSV